MSARKGETNVFSWFWKGLPLTRMNWTAPSLLRADKNDVEDAHTKMRQSKESKKEEVGQHVDKVQGESLLFGA